VTLKRCVMIGPTKLVGAYELDSRFLR